MKTNRRNFLKLTGLVGAGLTGANILPAYGKNPLHNAAVNDDFQPLNRFPQTVHEYFVERVRTVEKNGEERRGKLATKQDAENYIRETRARIQQCFAPWPDKTPLNSRVTSVHRRDGYDIENVIFDSRPDFPVTANLYVPKGRQLPLPGVVATCGHSITGKAAASYQYFAQGLARQGYVVLIFDPIGQGERLQYMNEDLQSRYGVGVLEHLHAGNQMVLTGESLSSWFAWDGIRALDYLLTRPEVDPAHIGLTGNSGGGTQATWLCGVEPRFTMAAPSCFITTFRRNMENELPADTEQYPPKALAMGLDHSDFIAAMAPKPVIMIGQEKDYFDARGLEESFERLRNIYRLLGAEDNISCFIGPDYHGFHPSGREAMYRWFNRVTGISELKTEPSLILEEDETLLCTPRGQVGVSGSRTVFSFTGELSAALAAKRNGPQGNELKEAVVEYLKLPEYKGVPGYRILRPLPNRGYPKRFACPYLVETEPGIRTAVYRLDDNRLLSRPPGGSNNAILYVSHLSADQELRQETYLHGIIERESDSALFACDVRGTGETLPNTSRDDFHAPYGNDYLYAGHSVMLDYPYPGQRTQDVLRIIEWILSFGHPRIHIVATGWGAIPATFASLLSGSVSQVTLKNALTSYTDIAEQEDYDWPLSLLLPGVLESFDLPDCYRDLGSKNLKQIEPWGALDGRK